MFRAQWILENGIIQRIVLFPSPQLTIRCLGASLCVEALIYQWVEAYKAQREPNVTLPLALSSLPLFTQRVLRSIQSISFGEVATYKEIATKIGKPTAFRAVGNICQRNPFPLVIPCHRIVRSDGKIGGYSGGIKVKQRLLDFEKANPLPKSCISSYRSTSASCNMAGREGLPSSSNTI